MRSLLNVQQVYRPSKKKSPCEEVSRSVSVLASIILSFPITAVPARAQTIEWIRQFGTNRQDQGLAVAKGPSGVYVAGTTLGVFPGETNSGVNELNAFITRYDEQGNAVWTRQFGNTTSRTQVEAKGVTTDQTGVYVVGLTDAALAGQTSVGATDAFIRKYDLVETFSGRANSGR